jgi:hypothetical protein
VISAFFDRHEWSYAKLEPTIWLATFATDDGGEFDLYVMSGEEWIHFAISPFLPKPMPECQARLFATLLQLNQQIRLAYFGVDEEGDVNLLVDMPARGFDYRQFAQAVDSLHHYSETLAPDLGRVATEPSFHSSLF